MPRWGAIRLTATASCLLLGRSFALDPNRPPHHVRQAVSGDNSITATSSQEAGGPSISDSVATTTNAGPSIACEAEGGNISDAMPTDPPELESFSRSYYDSHPRTAGNPIFECDWIAEVPQDLDDAAREAQNMTAEWVRGLDPDGDGELHTDTMRYLECLMVNSDTLPCQVEWNRYIRKLDEREESGGVGVMDVMVYREISVSVLAAVGVSLLGIV